MSASESPTAAAPPTGRPARDARMPTTDQEAGRLANGSSGSASRSSLFFLILADLRPADRALRLRPGQPPRRCDFPKQGRPTAPTSSAPTVAVYDVLSRVIWGARTAIEVVVLAVVFSLSIGVPLGLISGYVGGRLDRVLVLVMDALFAFPYLLLAIVIAFLLSDKLGQGIVTRRSRSRSSTCRSTSGWSETT